MSFAAAMIAAAGLKFKAHPHMLRHACGFSLANKGHHTGASTLSRAQGASEKHFISLTRGERENCPAFFPIIWPDRTESADFLALELVKLRSTFYFLPSLRQHLFRSFCVVETTRLNLGSAPAPMPLCI